MPRATLKASQWWLFTGIRDAAVLRPSEKKCRYMQEVPVPQRLQRDRYFFSKNRTTKTLRDQYAKLARFFSAVYPILLQIE
jgi:hypothetical protein